MWFARGHDLDFERRQLLDALRALRRGDFEISLPPGAASADGEIAATFNDVVQLARSLQHELRDVRVAVGKEGHRTRRLRDAGMRGGWAACAWAVNELLDDVLAGTPRDATGGRARRDERRGDKAQCDRFEAVAELLAGALGAAREREPALPSPRPFALRDERPEQRAFERKLSDLESRNEELERKLGELRTANARLAEDAERQRDASARKSRFLAAMSHELRAPLHTLLILSQKLASASQGSLQPPLAEYLEAIGEAGGDLLSLANDLVDVAKLESGALGVEVASVAIAEFVDYAERSFQPIATRRRLTFRVSVDPELPVMLETDVRRVKQVLRNLLENAFKFTERGGVRLSIFRNERRDGIAFAVADTGIGIAHADQAAIFEPFKQLAEPAARADQGAGLGLSISREIARALGGSLHVSSLPARGSTFTLELPLAAAKLDVAHSAASVAPQRSRTIERGVSVGPAAHTPEQIVDEEPALANRRVRVVNGDVRDVFAVAAALEPHSVRIFYGDTEEAADVVLVDIDRPGANAHHALQRIRTKYPEVVLFAMAPRAERNAREVCIAAGADECIGKPLDPAELIGALKVWFPASH